MATNMATTAATDDPVNVAIITCSTRKPRLNPYISAHVRSLLEPLVAASQSPRPIILHDIDLAAPEHALPSIIDDPLVPVQIPAADPTPHYADARTRAWSATMASMHAFVFVTPQYNWSFPASLKHALDVLFHEWVGKPALIVTYGGERGAGAQSGEQLASVLGGGLRMRLVQDVKPKFACRHDVLFDLARVERVGGFEEEQLKAWDEVGSTEDVKRGWEDLIRLLGVQ